MKKIILFTLISGLLFSFANGQNSKPVRAEKQTDKIYQYSIFTALANKIYDGTITVADVKKNGDTGLGTFNGLDGEMIVCDGQVYQWTGSGKLNIPEDNQLVPFAVVSFFEADHNIEVSSEINYNEMKAKIESRLPSKNMAYTFKIRGEFDVLKCGSANKQEKPFANTLSEALVNRPTFDLEDISGTLVGFWYPEYIGKINVPGFHLHFISDDKKHAGHVLEFKASNLKIGIDQCNGFNIELVNTKEFEKSELDLTQKYNKR